MIDIFAAFDKAISTGDRLAQLFGRRSRSSARDPKRRRGPTAPQLASRFQAASERSMVANRLEAFRAVLG